MDDLQKKYDELLLQYENLSKENAVLRSLLCVPANLHLLRNKQLCGIRKYRSATEVG